MAVIGIDLGTTNSLGAVWKEGEVCLIADGLGNRMVPSVVAIDEEGNILTGQAAREEELLHPERCASNFKRYMGTEKVYSLAGRKFTPEELSALILRRIRKDAEEYLGEEITEAVISVPAYFNNDQRYATKLAAELAGIYCERMINEPSAAALAARKADMEGEQLFLVFDFGGGTLDVSIVDCFEDIVEITAIAGDNHLGGTDFDQAIARAFCEENGVDWNCLEKSRQQALLFESRRCKEQLSARNEAMLEFCIGTDSYAMELTTNKIFQIGQRLFQRMKNVISRAVRDSGLGLEDITNVLLAGGSSRLPAVQMFLSRLFERDVMIGEEPDLLIARGLGVYTGIKERREEVKDLMMTDVCPFSLGTSTAGNAPGDPEKMCMMIERNSVLPCRAEMIFTTSGDYQDRILFKIYQGENYNPDANLKIGELGIPVVKAPKGKARVQVAFTYNINGILEVSAVDCYTKASVKTTVVSGYKQLSTQQIAAIKGQMEGMKYLPREQEERKAILAMGERLYAETVGDARRYVEQALGYYQHAWSTSSPIQIRKAGKRVMQMLLNVEVEQNYSVFEEFFDDSREE